MLREGELYFNGERSLNMNLFLEEYPYIPISNENYEEVNVEGRNGSFIVNKGTYPNKKITFTFTILSSEIEIDFEKVYEWLTEIKDNRLIFGREDRCYRVKKVIFGNIQKEFKNIGEFDTTFICEPFLTEIQEFEIDITQLNNYYYNGNIEGEPIIQIWGSGNIQLAINDENFIVKNVKSYVKIDSKLFKVVDSNDNDLESQGGFPLLTRGNNTILTLGTVNKILLTPRTSYKN